MTTRATDSRAVVTAHLSSKTPTAPIVRANSKGMATMGPRAVKDMEGGLAGRRPTSWRETSATVNPRGMGRSPKDGHLPRRPVTVAMTMRDTTAVVNTRPTRRDRFIPPPTGNIREMRCRRHRWPHQTPIMVASILAPLRTAGPSKGTDSQPRCNNRRPILVSNHTGNRVLFSSNSRRHIPVTSRISRITTPKAGGNSSFEWAIWISSGTYRWCFSS